MLNLVRLSMTVAGQEQGHLFSTSSGTSVYIAVRTTVIDITAVVLNLVELSTQAVGYVRTY